MRKGTKIGAINRSRGRRRLSRGGRWGESEPDRRADEQAENRRKLIANMDRDTALFATKEFAKLGLYQ